jgi:hypothetical protein
MYQLIHQNDRKKSALEESAEAIFYSVYGELGEAILDELFGDYPYIFIGDLVDKVYQELYFEEYTNLIDESILRGDHEIYALSKDDYTLQVYGGNIGLYYEPAFEVSDIKTMISQMLCEQNIAYLDYDFTMQNEIILEVW